MRQKMYNKLLHFIDTTEHYNAAGLYGLLSSQGKFLLYSLATLLLSLEKIYEARAILLGRLGRHDQALELYAYWLQDYLKAEK
jgi:Vam6/Vps39-like protein vacuolar protein sorting-associated protein 39